MDEGGHHIRMVNDRSGFNPLWTNIITYINLMAVNKIRNAMVSGPG